MNAFDREHPNQQYLFPRATATASASASHNTPHFNLHNQSISQQSIKTRIVQPKFGLFLSQLHQLCILLQDGYTPVHYASGKGKLEVVRYLIEECGANVNAKSNVSGFE
jgi:ankyrin repeat protein